MKNYVTSPVDAVVGIDMSRQTKHEFHPKLIRADGFERPVQFCIKCLVVRLKVRGVFNYWRTAGYGEHMGTGVVCSKWNHE